MNFYYNNSEPEYEYSLTYSMPKKIINTEHIELISGYYSNNIIAINADPIYIRNCIIGVINVYSFYNVTDPRIIFYTIECGNKKTNHIGYMQYTTNKLMIVREILPNLPEILHMNRGLGVIESMLNPDNDLPVLYILRLGFSVSDDPLL